MKDYFSLLELSRDISFEVFQATLEDLQKKWTFRASSGTTAQKRSEAEIKVELINEAMCTIETSSALEQYRFALNNSFLNRDTVDTNEQENTLDESSQKVFDNARDNFVRKDYLSSYNLLAGLISSGSGTPDVYELAINSLLYQNKPELTLRAIEYGREGLFKGHKNKKMYQALINAYIKANKVSDAYDFILQMKSSLPNDVEVDFYIAKTLMEDIYQQYAREARIYIDSLLSLFKEDNYASLTSSPIIAIWDVKWTYNFGNSFPLLVSKISNYSSGVFEKDNEFYAKTHELFKAILEHISQNNYSQFEEYFKSSDSERQHDIDICCEKYDVCFVVMNLSRTQNAESLSVALDDVYKKYSNQKISNATYSIIERYSKKNVSELPSYKLSVNSGFDSLVLENESDYASVRRVLEPLSMIQKRNSCVGTDISEILEEVEQLPRSAREAKKRKSCTIVRNISWAIKLIFLMPIFDVLFSITLNAINGNSSSLSTLTQQIADSFAGDFSAVLFAGYLLYANVMILAMFKTLNNKNKLWENDAIALVTIIPMLLSYFAKIGLPIILLLSLVYMFSGELSGLGVFLANSFNFIKPIHDVLRFICAVVPYIIIPGWIVAFVISRKYRKICASIHEEIRKLNDCTSIIKWIKN